MPGSAQQTARDQKPAGILDWIEWLGNKLPDPVFLFAGAAVFVMLVSALAAGAGWSVQPVRPQLVESAGAPGMPATPSLPATPAPSGASGPPRIRLVDFGVPVTARSLLSSEGLHWAITSMVKNFINFPPLGIVLVGMLGVGLAEKVGLLGSLMKALALVTPRRFLTPMVIFLGLVAHITADAGFIFLPPLAAGLFAAVGRSPIAGLAAAYAGIAGGFSANFIPSATDALVGGITTDACRALDAKYSVTPIANWWFMSASTVMLTLVGWAICAWITEPRLATHSPDEGGPAEVGMAADGTSPRLLPEESRALGAVAITLLVLGGIVAAAILVPGAPLNGNIEAAGAGAPTPKWTQAIIPIVFFAFAIPGIVYGKLVGILRTQKDVAGALISAIVSMAPMIVLAFFAAQFLEYLKYTNLDKMLAFTGGKALVSSGLPPLAILPALILLSLTINMLIASMSAKWLMMAPVIVPMLMMAGIAPELTQSAYRIGDSVTNCVTPMNPYALIILVTMTRYWKRAGMGTLMAIMTPYSVVFAIVWAAMLVLWVALGIPLGPGANLWYVPR